MSVSTVLFVDAQDRKNSNIPVQLELTKIANANANLVSLTLSGSSSIDYQINLEDLKELLRKADLMLV